MKDRDGREPAIVMIAGNRTAGKTFWAKNFLVQKYLKTGRKFIVLQRFGYALTGMSDVFFKDLKEVKKQYFDMEMTENVVVKNCINELLLNGNPCGYCVALNNADSIKRNSTLFVDVDYIFLDEFQSETGKYVPDEIQKFISIYTSVARGNGEQARFVKCILCSNNVSLLNPYYSSLGVAYLIQENTKFLRGTGWVLELTFNENASEAQKNSAFGRAFEHENYMKFTTSSVYLNDSYTFVDKPHEDVWLSCVVEYKGVPYGVWVGHQFLYITTKYNKECRFWYAIDVKEHGRDTLLLTKCSMKVKWWKECFERGLFRFENLACKEVMFALLGY